ncbi:glycosyltransferase [Clostridium sp. 'White wine YQ']|uniref:glycosyltransferase n=1 Tax=Clostridium sp. 'White wine YQ' TaxID=3027474 RepID=UPI00236724B4|nr:glycosyltransferase [Clostridium sp. 'White wine YQ']MDD7795331.1 glycosyltransferase [Clostridium sp. 'White wine YQ']
MQSSKSIIYKNNKKKCLVICHFFSVYTKNFLINLKASLDIEFDLLTMDENYRRDKISDSLNEVFIYKSLNEMKDILRDIKVYDIIHIHFLAPFYGQVFNEIREKCTKLIVTVWGSDFYRTISEDKKYQEKIIEVADNINFGNGDTLKEFDNFYNNRYSQKLSVCRFGLIQLDYIKRFMKEGKDKIKKELKCPQNSIIITCGHNASPAQNHILLIESLIRIKDKLPDRCYFLFPMTYGDGDIVNKVSEKLCESGLKYMILDEFLSDEDVAKLRVISDIMIHVQTTDQLSGSMQEYLYAGNVVITGSWLPYEIFKNKDVYLLEVNRVEDVGEKVIYAIENLEKLIVNCEENKEKIWNMTSWKKVIDTWRNVYKE